MNEFSNLIQLIRDTVKSGIPGSEAQKIMSPSIRTAGVLPDRNRKLREGAVVILLFPEDGLCKTVFIKRPEYTGPHSNEVSLPGGKYETEDGSLLKTAIRETYEEVGVKISTENIITEMTSLHIPVSANTVYPFLAYTEYTPKFIPEESEVQYIIKTPINNFLDNSLLKKGTRTIRGIKVDYPYYYFENEIIWGATAMICSEFAEILRKTKSFY